MEIIIHKLKRNGWPFAYMQIRPSGVLCGQNNDHGCMDWPTGAWK